MSTKSFVVGLAIALIAVGFVDVDPTFWSSRESAKIHMAKDELFKFITDPTKTTDVSSIKQKCGHFDTSDYIKRRSVANAFLSLFYPICPCQDKPVCRLSLHFRSTRKSVALLPLT
jgi:hypothetical protein